MTEFGLIGRSLTHSFSPKYFLNKFESEGISDTSYSAIELEDISELRAELKSRPNLKGFNVTIPYKESIIPMLDELDESAREINAVNTVSIKEGKLIGSNTDAFGFTRSLAAVFKPHHERALVLGTGGASKAVSYALKQLGVEHVFVSRTKRSQGLTYGEVNDLVLRYFPLIINTTPLGMYPNVDACPEIPYEYLTERNLLYDLVYNPEETEFLRRGNAQGTATLNGYRMLVLQAEKSWEIWHS